MKYSDTTIYDIYHLMHFLCKKNNKIYDHVENNCYWVDYITHCCLLCNEKMNGSYIDLVDHAVKHLKEYGLINLL